MQSSYLAAGGAEEPRSIPTLGLGTSSGAEGLSLWLGAIPFVALGLTIGSLLPAEVAQPVSMIGMFAFAILGGLWFPADVMGGTMRTIAHLMPAYHYADMGWSITQGLGLPLSDVLIVLGWAVAMGVVATWSYRRATVRG
ncbi:hypothetical protein AB0B45_34555 [Nonomuraea sp. NPDC049152]|uniref:ABC transporter permease n=1 Tax=Nonomuraea sp. NPDC049152 TaxID=3154350 RepID=UPI0033C0A97E